MNKLHAEITIAAPRAVVWDTMLAPDTYRVWAAEFMPGSYYEGSWKQGADIRFLAPDGGGMRAVIAENRPHEFLSIRHLGEIESGAEAADRPGQSWENAFENYTLTDEAGGTRLQVDMDVVPEFEDYMKQTWPRALARLREICERRAG